jgi:hypothetical protein
MARASIWIDGPQPAEKIEVIFPNRNNESSVWIGGTDIASSETTIASICCIGLELHIVAGARDAICP